MVGVQALFACGREFTLDSLDVLLVPDTIVGDDFHIRVSGVALESFLSEFLDSDVVSHYLRFGISIDDLVARRFLSFSLWAGFQSSSDFSSHSKVRALFSTDDGKYLMDVHGHLLRPIHNSIVGKAKNSSKQGCRSFLAGLPPNSGINFRMADSVREIFMDTDLGEGNGKRLSDTVQHLFQALLYHDLWMVVLGYQIGLGHYYLSCMENVVCDGFEDIWLPGFLDSVPEEVVGLFRDLLRGVDMASGLDMYVGEYHVKAVVRAVSEAVVYRSGATNMRNNHGGDGFAVLSLDDRFIGGLVSLSGVDREIVRTVLEGFPDRFRICMMEGKTSEGSKTVKGLFFDFGKEKFFSFAKNCFHSYVDELSNLAVQVNHVLDQYGVASRLPAIGMYRADPVPNWDPRSLLDLDSLQDGYRDVLAASDPCARVVGIFGAELKSIIESVDEGLRSALTGEIVRNVILPHFRVRQVLYDVSVLEEFLLSGREFVFNPACIGAAGDRESHVLVREIDASNPPMLPVRLPDGSDDFIVLSPLSRFFRRDGEGIAMGFDLVSSRQDNPFKLSDDEIFGIIRSGKFMDHLQGLLDTYAKMRAGNKRVLFLETEEALEVRGFIVQVSKMLAGSVPWRHLAELLMGVTSGHILNFFRQEVLDRLTKNPVGLQSLFIDGNRFGIRKVIHASGNQRFYNQLMEYALSTTCFPFRYDEIVLSSREKVPYVISTAGRGRSKARERSGNLVKAGSLRGVGSSGHVRGRSSGKPGSLGKSGFSAKGGFSEKDGEIPVRDAYQVAMLIAGSRLSHRRLGLRFEKEGSMGFIDVSEIPLPFSEPYFRNNDFTNGDVLKAFIQGILISRENRWANGVEYLRFPLSLHGNATLRHPFLDVPFKGRVLDWWRDLDRLMQIGSANSRVHSRLMSALDFNIENLTGDNFQATLELCKFGPFRTQFSSIFGVVNDWLSEDSLDAMDEIARSHAESIDHLFVSAGKRGRRVETGNFKIEVNDGNRLIWYLDAIAEGHGQEIPLFFKEEKLGCLQALIGLTPADGYKMDDLFGQSRQIGKDTMPRHIATFLEIFYRQHLITEQQLTDLVSIFERNVLVQRRGKIYTTHRLLEGLDHRERKGQIQVIASFLNLNGIFRAPCGRFVSDKKVLVATKSPISFNILDVRSSGGQISMPTVKETQKAVQDAFSALI